MNDNRSEENRVEWASWTHTADYILLYREKNGASDCVKKGTRRATHSEGGGVEYQSTINRWPPRRRVLYAIISTCRVNGVITSRVCGRPDIVYYIIIITRDRVYSE